MDRIGQRDPVLEDEVKYRYNSVIQHYRKSFVQDNAQRYNLCSDNDILVMVILNVSVLGFLLDYLCLYMDVLVPFSRNFITPFVSLRFLNKLFRDAPSLWHASIFGNRAQILFPNVPHKLILSLNVISSIHLLCVILPLLYRNETAL